MAGSYASYPPSGGAGIAKYATFASFPATATDGAIAEALDTNDIYAFNAGSAMWILIGGPGVAISIGAFGSTPNTAGLSITADVLQMQPADATHPGGISTGTQTIAGNKTFSGTVTVGQLIDSGLTASTVPYADASKQLTSSAVTPTELGYVSGVTSAIQTQLNSKQATLTIGNFTDAGTDGIIVTGGTGAVIGSGTSIAQHVADATHNGYLSSADWVTFNTGSAGAANQSLSNLTNPTALNQSLLVDTTATYTLGNTSKYWASAFIADIFDNSGNKSIEPFARSLYSTNTNESLNWGSFIAYDNAHKASINWKDRQLSDATPTTQLSWGTSGVGLPQLTAARALIVNGSGFIDVSATTSTELGYVNGVTSAIQTQLNAKQATGNYITALTGDVTASGPGSVVATLAATSNTTLTSLANLATVGTITSGTWSGTAINVAHGGTGDTSLTAYAVLCGGTTTMAAVQSVASVGTSGQVLVSNGASALPTFQTFSGQTNILSKTANYNAVAGDYILADATSASFTITLPTAVGISGQSIWVLRTDNTLIANGHNVAYATTSSQTIAGNAASTYHSYTVNELYQFTSDNSNWQLSLHRAVTDPQSFTMTPGATTTPPTKVTSPTSDDAFWFRDQKYLCFTYLYDVTGGSGGNNGSGTYKFPLPANMSVDTTFVKVSTDVSLFGKGTVVGNGVASTNAANFNISMMAFDASNVYANFTAAGGTWSSTTLGFAAASNTHATFSVRVPISGWTA